MQPTKGRRGITGVIPQLQPWMKESRAGNKDSGACNINSQEIGTHFF